MRALPPGHAHPSTPWSVEQSGYSPCGSSIFYHRVYSSNFTLLAKQVRYLSQIFNRKSNSRNITHRQSFHLQAMTTGETIGRSFSVIVLAISTCCVWNGSCKICHMNCRNLITILTIKSLFNLPLVQSRQHGGGGFSGLRPPKQISKPPKLKYESHPKLRYETP